MRDLTDGLLDGRTDGRTDGWTDERMDGWTDGRWTCRRCVRAIKDNRNDEFGSDMIVLLRHSTCATVKRKNANFDQLSFPNGSS